MLVQACVREEGKKKKKKMLVFSNAFNRSFLLFPLKDKAKTEVRKKEKKIFKGFCEQ